MDLGGARPEAHGSDMLCIFIREIRHSGLPVPCRQENEARLEPSLDPHYLRGTPADESHGDNLVHFAHFRSLRILGTSCSFPPPPPPSPLPLRVSFQCSADSLTVSVQPPCAIACTNICAHVKSPKHWQPYHTTVRLHENTVHTDPALAAAVPYPSKATRISRKGQ